MNMQYLGRYKPNSPSISMVVNHESRAKSITINIDKAIGPANDFIPMVQMLLNAVEQDDITILINTPGGYVSTGFFITDAMTRCKAKITTNIIGIAYSCGAVIWGYGDIRKISKHGRGMFHTASGGYSGKIRNMREAAECSEQNFLIMFNELKERGVLSQEQYSNCLDKKRDIYFTRKDYPQGDV